jgi:transposase
VHEELEACFTATTVELIGKNNERITSHVRSYVRGGHTTNPEHMPKSHQKHLEWTPSRIIHWAGTVGPNTQALVEAILKDRPHPEMGYRSCLGILRLAQDKRYGPQRLEPACARALLSGARSYHHVASILKHGLDRIALAAPARDAQHQLPLHENIRGRGYYQ